MRLTFNVPDGGEAPNSWSSASKFPGIDRVVSVIYCSEYSVSQDGAEDMIVLTTVSPRLYKLEAWRVVRAFGKCGVLVEPHQGR